MRIASNLMLGAAFGSAMALAATGAASAKEAQCYTTDDGQYDCEFVATADDGSFEIFGADVPSYAVVMDGPDVAYVYATFESDGRSVPLPGTYHRSRQDGACWVSDATQAELCAW